jgi:DNA-binding GntR family transcriptional regulator
MGKVADASEHGSGRIWEHAYREIKDQVLSLSLKPGAMVSEVSIAEKLGVSRTPVREAIKVLEQEGLIETRKRRKYVYILRVQELEEIFDLKIAIEAAMARRAAERRDVTQARQMQKTLDRIAAFSEQDLSDLTHDHRLVDEWLGLDREFHHLVFAMARNRKAEAVVANLNHLWHRLQIGILAMEGRLRNNLGEHIEIGEAIVAGDANAAQRSMVEHLERLRKTLVNLFQIFHFPG